MKRYLTGIIFAWILVIGVDFLFHASIFVSLWSEDVAIFKSTKELSILLPVGYLSFLFLSVFIGYLFFKIFTIKPALKEVLIFGFIIGILYFLINILGLFSYVKMPVKQLIIFNLISFVEIIVITLSLYFTLFAINLKRVIWFTILCFVLLLISGMVIQNI